ncbi:MAG: flavin reductase family protein, partial [Acidimicrobiia bacterium]
MIHEGNPFVDEPSDRDPARRFRGRLAAPVTIVTSGSGDTMTGLTVSSLLVIEGNPAQIALVVGPTSDLWDAIASNGRFVVHIASQRHQGLAERFAGRRPAAGGLLTDIVLHVSEWGPVIDDLPDRAYCTSTSMTESGWSGRVIGNIDRADLTDLSDPLTYFRG